MSDDEVLAADLDPRPQLLGKRCGCGAQMARGRRKCDACKGAAATARRARQIEKQRETRAAAMRAQGKVPLCDKAERRPKKTKKMERVSMRPADATRSHRVASPGDARAWMKEAQSTGHCLRVLDGAPKHPLYDSRAGRAERRDNGEWPEWLRRRRFACECAGNAAAEFKDGIKQTMSQRVQEALGHEAREDDVTGMVIEVDQLVSESQQRIVMNRRGDAAAEARVAARKEKTTDASRAARVNSHLGCPYRVLHMWRCSEDGTPGAVDIYEFGEHNEECCERAADNTLYQPLSDELREWVARLVEAGVPAVRILNFAGDGDEARRGGFPLPAVPEDERDLQRHRVCQADVRAAVTAFRHRERRSAGDVRSTLAMLIEHTLKDPECVLWHVAQQFDPTTNKTKVPFELVLQTPLMRKRCRQMAALPQGKHFFLDATGSVTRYGFNMFTLFMLDESGAGMPVAKAVLQRKNKDAIFNFLRAVFWRNVELDPYTIMVDMDEAEANAIMKLNELLGSDIKVRWCWYHIVAKLREKFKGDALQRAGPTILALLRRVRRAVTDGEQRAWYNLLIDYVRGTGVPEAKAVDDFLVTIFAVRQRWSMVVGNRRSDSPFSPNTNNVLERHHLTFKKQFCGQRRMQRVDDLINRIMSYSYSLQRHKGANGGVGHAVGRRQDAVAAAAVKAKREMLSRTALGAYLVKKNKVRVLELDASEDGDGGATMTIIAQCAQTSRDVLSLADEDYNDEEVDEEVLRYEVPRGECRVRLCMQGDGSVTELSCTGCAGDYDSLPCAHALALILKEGVNVKGLVDASTRRTDVVSGRLRTDVSADGPRPELPPGGWGDGLLPDLVAQVRLALAGDDDDEAPAGQLLAGVLQVVRPVVDEAAIFHEMEPSEYALDERDAAEALAATVERLQRGDADDDDLVDRGDDDFYITDEEEAGEDEDEEDEEVGEVRSFDVLDSLKRRVDEALARGHEDYVYTLMRQTAAFVNKVRRRKRRLQPPSAMQHHGPPRSDTVEQGRAAKRRQRELGRVAKAGGVAVANLVPLDVYPSNYVRNGGQTAKERADEHYRAQLNNVIAVDNEMDRDPKGARADLFARPGGGQM
jgi:hypothetical protein